jgi:hypothetical protein
MAIPSATEDEISGRALYGDSFSPDQIREWHESEVTGYFDLLSDHYKITDADNRYPYEYDALNEFHAILQSIRPRLIWPRHSACCTIFPMSRMS